MTHEYHKRTSDTESNSIHCSCFWAECVVTNFCLHFYTVSSFCVLCLLQTFCFLVLHKSAWHRNNKGIHRHIYFIGFFLCSVKTSKWNFIDSTNKRITFEYREEQRPRQFLAIKLTPLIRQYLIFPQVPVNKDSSYVQLDFSYSVASSVFTILGDQCSSVVMAAEPCSRHQPSFFEAVEEPRSTPL